MDFFSHQDQARKRTGHLVILFGLAVITLIVLLNLMLAAALWYSDGPAGGIESLPDILYYMQPEQWLMVSGGVLVVVGGASLVKWLMLRGGGKTVAESLGGRLLNPDTNNFYEKRLLNVVEEMSIASGMPVPPIYILDDDSINAFAAGYQPSDAVLGVTKGTMEQLSRDQLQGVIAHEFSHIFNGDMRLNIRLMAILFGILFIGMIGRFILESAMHSRHRRSSNNKNNPAPLMAIGLGLVVIGYGGVFFGNLIKAAVSRQREFLADASAVQFTRNPDSIGGALKVIGHGAGSEIHSPERDETAHLFFGQAMPFKFGWFKTHPPLEERIQRVDKHWDGQYLAPQSRRDAEAEVPEIAAATRRQNEQQKLQTVEMVATTAITAGAALAGNKDQPIEYSPVESAIQPNSPSTEQATEQSTEQASTGISHNQALSRLTDAAHETYSARSLIFVLLLAPASRVVHEQQLDIIRQQHGQDLFKISLRLIQMVEKIQPEERLPLVEKAIPALKQLSAEQYQEFRQTVVRLAKADGEIDIFEWCLYRLVLRYLEPTFEDVKPVKAKHNKPQKLYPELSTVLSYLAHYGHDTQEAAEKAFAICVEAAGFDDKKMTLQPASLNSLKPLNLALAKLTEAYPHVKGRALKAMVACVKADGSLRPVELDLVRTIAAILECPVPGLFDEK